jgi:hypothetical protein
MSHHLAIYNIHTRSHLYETKRSEEKSHAFQSTSTRLPAAAAARAAPAASDDRWRRGRGDDEGAVTPSATQDSAVHAADTAGGAAITHDESRQSQSTILN